MFGLGTIGGFFNTLGQYVTAENIAKVGAVISEASNVLDAGYRTYRTANKVYNDIAGSPVKIASATRYYPDGSTVSCVTYEKPNGERIFEIVKRG